MENKNLNLNIFVKQNFQTKNETVDFIINQLANDDRTQELLLNEFLYRENVGSIQIAGQVILPHLETDLLNESKVILLTLENEVEKWTENIHHVKLIIVLALKESESIENKKKISNFVRKLADDLFIAELLNAENENTIRELIKFN